ncbi:hypothetical protein CKA32_006829 [Geitlerinema sp. FC II]|nr:hypothetical protein CKA32_006829 [Geitlerinema sp. FC II]
MKNQREVHRAIAYLNQTLKEHKGTVLSDVQEAVARGAMEGFTYEKMAQQEGYHYGEKYLKEVGSQLWKELESYWGVKVSKPKFRAALNDRMRRNPLPESTIPSYSPVFPNRYQWHNAFKLILLRASEYQNWLPGYNEQSDLDAYEQALSEMFAQLRYLDRYEELRHQWREVRGIVHVYDWSELRRDTLSWLLDRAERLGESKSIWRDRAELAWAHSVSGRPGAGAESLEQMETLWKQVSSICASPLAQFELLIYLCATTLTLNQFDKTARWLHEATSISEGSPAATRDRRWQRCKLDLTHYRAEYQAGIDQLNESIRLYEKALREARDLKCDRAVTRNLLGLAQVEIARSRAEAARHYLDTGFENVYSHCDRRGMGFFAKEQIRLVRATGDRERVVEWLDMAHSQFQSLGMTLQVQRSNQLV